MEDRGFEKKASNGMQWLDIAMVKSPEDFADDGGGRSHGGARGDPGPYPDDDVPL